MIAALINISALSVSTSEPVAAFSTNGWFATAPAFVNFYDNSSNNPMQWNWYINGVRFSTDKDATYYFQYPGIYTVKLVVSNSQGSDEISINLEITANSEGGPELL